jgi:ubiquinone/menaquinone biosynthesis C-methylase UbiE
LLDNRAAEAERRFGALSALYNPVTFRHVDALGIQYGWRCWEVGAGGPSVPSWLADRVGPTGRVLATDIDTSWIDHLEPRIDVRQHDVAHDDPPLGPVDGFDLIHARLVLVHIPDRDEALRRMASALRPGGWLLIEDFDIELQPLARIDAYKPEHDAANKIRTGFRALLAQRGVDKAYGRKLPRLLAGQGLIDVTADAYMSVTLPAMGALEVSNVEQVGDALVAQEHATAEEIQSHLAAIEDGMGLASPPLISACGRKPPA